MKWHDAKSATTMELRGLVVQIQSDKSQEIPSMQISKRAVDLRLFYYIAATDLPMVMPKVTINPRTIFSIFSTVFDTYK